MKKYIIKIDKNKDMNMNMNDIKDKFLYNNCNLYEFLK